MDVESSLDPHSLQVERARRQEGLLQRMRQTVEKVWNRQSVFHVPSCKSVTWAQTNRNRFFLSWDVPGCPVIRFDESFKDSGGHIQPTDRPTNECPPIHLCNHQFTTIAFTNGSCRAVLGCNSPATKWMCHGPSHGRTAPSKTRHKRQHLHCL